MSENHSIETDPGFSLRAQPAPQQEPDSAAAPSPEPPVQPSRYSAPQLSQVPEEHREWARQGPALPADLEPVPMPAEEAALPPEVIPVAPPVVEVRTHDVPRTGTGKVAHEGTGLRVRDLRVFYGPVPAVRGVSLDCPPGTVVGVIGANGAGKTSLLSGIAGLVKTQGGTVDLDGRNISSWPAHRRGQAGIVYVAERRRVFPSLSVRENLTVGGWGLDKAEVNARVDKIFEMFPRLREREKVPSFRLSGGEQRMVSIGRALVTGARVILFDELSLGLAPRIVSELIGTVRGLADEGRIIVLVEQYIGVLLKTADTIDVLERGRVRFSGPSQQAAAWLEESGYMAHARAAGERAGAQSPAAATRGE
ncbi:MAG TPA: ATP-binding cassette domain-containing protein [Candidatus Dormibacteraeota bacterium]|jgi:branched-chain amino acid transport system ATP-binding protein|nr:ATP-binding cassette domain-containing protein [Candidatus Dormibacteraeota bacterium]